MDIEKMKDKFKGLVFPVLSWEQARDIFYKIRALEEESDIAEILSLCSAP
jgi:hypothetical protein